MTKAITNILVLLFFGINSFFITKNLLAANVKTSLEIEDWNNPFCGRFNKWINHLEKNNFDLVFYYYGNIHVREKFGITQDYASCHIALIDGYPVKVHLPSFDIKNLSNKKIKSIVVLVPSKSSGIFVMDGPKYVEKKDLYNVYLINSNKFAVIFNSNN